MEASQPPTFSTPLPVNVEEDKLDWLLQINEEMYQQELKKIVSTIMPSYSLLFAVGKTQISTNIFRVFIKFLLSRASLNWNCPR